MSAQPTQSMERTPTPTPAPTLKPSRRSTHLRNTWHLGIKEFHSLARDMALLFLIVFMFSVSIYADARAKPESLNRASIAVVDEDRSQLSTRMVAALQPPQFITPEQVGLADMDRGMDAGRHTFVLDIPPGFQRDVSPAAARRCSSTSTPPARARRRPAPATSRPSSPTRSAPSCTACACRRRSRWSWCRAPCSTPTSTLVVRGDQRLINNVTMLGILLTGAALIREREHGTIEHLLVMPVTPLEIMLSKIWSMGVVVLVASSFSLQVW
jgi:ABC-type multidrug transport system, permease component